MNIPMMVVLAQKLAPILWRICKPVLKKAGRAYRDACAEDLEEMDREEIDDTLNRIHLDYPKLD